MKYITLILSIFILFLIAQLAYAQVEPIDANKYNLPAGDIKALVDSAVNWVVGIAGPACLVALIYGGIRYAFSGGNEEKAERAKRIMKYATIGVAIVIASYAITQIIIAWLRGEGPEPPEF